MKLGGGGHATEYQSLINGTIKIRNGHWAFTSICTRTQFATEMYAKHCGRSVQPDVTHYEVVQTNLVFVTKGDSRGSNVHSYKMPQSKHVRLRLALFTSKNCGRFYVKTPCSSE